jgi:hypothetical protein
VDKPEQAAANPLGVDVTGCRIDHFAALKSDQCHDWSSLSLNLTTSFMKEKLAGIRLVVHLCSRH